MHRCIGETDFGDNVMNLRSAVLILALNVACSAAAIEEPGFTPPELKATLATKPVPKIDGDLSDELWKGAAVSEDFKLVEASPAKGHTKLYVTFDAQNLYIAVECFETAEGLKTLKTAATSHDQDEVWGDDSIEIFLDPANKRATYYQFIINAKGVFWDAFHDTPKSPDKTWQPQAQIAAKVGADRYTLEIALPWSCFNRSDKLEAEWAFNVVRSRPAAGEATYWSPLYSDTNHKPQRFGRLTGLPADRGH
jgi:hypothetical protein